MDTVQNLMRLLLSSRRPGAKFKVLLQEERHEDSQTHQGHADALGCGAVAAAGTTTVSTTAAAG